MKYFIQHFQVSRPGKEGFSLLEVMFAFSIFALVMVGVIWTLIAAQRIGQSARNRLDALQHSRASLEQVIASGYNSNPLQVGTHAVSRGGFEGQYIVTEPLANERKRIQMVYSYPSFGQTATVQLQMDVSNALH